MRRRTPVPAPKPKRAPKTMADKPWPEMPYLYECANGHQCGGPSPIERCLACVDGKPCPSPLVRYGVGARNVSAAA